MTDSIREKIAEIYSTPLPDAVIELSIRSSDPMRLVSEYLADQVLSLTNPEGEPLLYVLDDDQSLPIRKFFSDWGGTSGHAGYHLAQEDMLKAGFRRVRPAAQDNGSEK